MAISTDQYFLVKLVLCLYLCKLYWTFKHCCFLWFRSTAIQGGLLAKSACIAICKPKKHALPQLCNNISVNGVHACYIPNPGILKTPFPPGPGMCRILQWSWDHCVILQPLAMHITGWCREVPKGFHSWCIRLYIYTYKFIHVHGVCIKHMYVPKVYIRFLHASNYDPDFSE